MKSKIEGIKIIKKKIISDNRGKIMHMLRSDDRNFKHFGEIYFSQVYPKKIKAWHLHKKMTLNYVAVFGKIKLVLYDDRKRSKSYGKIQEIIISERNHKLISIPPFIWNGFCSVGKEKAILANCSDIPHDKKEIVRLPHDDPKFPYNWKKNF